ncbi:MAG TPA: serine/threonine-protein kinase, partial [Polyangia bacterium]
MEGERAFGPYRLLRRVAVGGMAEIYLAQAQGFGGFSKLIALKMIHQNYSLDEHFVQMLIDEAKISVQLQHVNIGQIFDLGRIGETYYITMEFIDGADLFKVLRRASEVDRDMPVEIAAFIAQEVCAGLDYAHHKTDDEGRPLGVIHRDISPQNVLVSHSGEVKIVDFGIAKAALRARQTAAGVIKGKYYYMSPEQAWGDPVDPRTDIFSAGILLYEMLTGQMLYLEDDLHRLLDRVRRADIAPPTTRRADVPPELERICMRALRKRPEDRWPTAHDFEAALQQFIFAHAPDFTPGRLAAFVRDVLAEDAPAPAVPAPAPPAATGERLAPDEHSVIFRLKDLADAVRQRPQPPPSPAVTGELDDGDDTALTALPPLAAFPSAEVTSPHYVTPERSPTPITALHEQRGAPGPASDFDDGGDPTIIDSGVRRFAPGAGAAGQARSRPRLPGIPDDTDLNEAPDATVAARPRSLGTPHTPARAGVAGTGAASGRTPAPAASRTPARPAPAGPREPPRRAAPPIRPAPAREPSGREPPRRPPPAAARAGAPPARRGGELEDIMELMAASRSAPVRPPPVRPEPRAVPPARSEPVRA